MKIRFIDRYTEIERENRILLEKMTTIMAAKPKINDGKLGLLKCMIL